ncbi:hypothetical protein NEILACOT_03265 [Neisseria lactamica ATCC 23970]|uniref:Uncharacterized protein n=1 Tax=Neisseria lactamica ATCC 23970 TaxID=546265 RepID=D0W6X4_NEILA|nr:hypothetical protein NEILACOT_03265 [Neisseria lactamica ATCC 23970]
MQVHECSFKATKSVFLLCRAIRNGLRNRRFCNWFEYICNPM